MYNLRWAGFARQVARLILDFYASRPIGQANKCVLDRCCELGIWQYIFLKRDIGSVVLACQNICSTMPKMVVSTLSLVKRICTRPCKRLVFEMKKVQEALLDVGWKNVYFARVQDVREPIDDPKKEGRVFVVVSR